MPIQFFFNFRVVLRPYNYSFRDVSIRFDPLSSDVAPFQSFSLVQKSTKIF